MTTSTAPEIAALIQVMEETLTHTPRDRRRLLDVFRECRAMGLDILPFDINRSACACEVEDERSIRLGFSILTGGSADHAAAIIRERERGGRFTSFQDFCERVPVETMPDDFVSRMIQSGGFDSVEPSRAGLFQARRHILQHVRLAQEEQATGQFSLFAQPAAAHGPARYQIPAVDEWTEAERIAHETDAIGISLEECFLDIEADTDDTEQQPEPAATDIPEDAPAPQPPASQPESANDLRPEPAESPASSEPSPAAPDTPPPPITPAPAAPAASEPADPVDRRTPPPPTPPEATPAGNDFETPPLPPCEFTIDDYEASFLEALPMDEPQPGAKKPLASAAPALPPPTTADAGPLAPETDHPTDARQSADSATPSTEAPAQAAGNAHAPRLVIKISSVTATERSLTRLERILRQFPGAVPVSIHCIDLENQATVIPAHDALAVDASDDCLAAIAGQIGYHAVQVHKA